MKLFLLSLFFVYGLNACAPTQNTRGNFLIAEDVQLLQAGLSTQNEVLNLLGSPTSKAVFDENIWYYVGLKTEKESFFDEKVTNRQVYKLEFGDNSVLQDIALVEGESLDIPLNERVTKTSGNQVTFIQQILGNIGKYNPSQSQ